MTEMLLKVSFGKQLPKYPATHLQEAQRLTQPPALMSPPRIPCGTVFDQQAAESARRPQSITALTEIQQYIKTPLLSRKEDPLLWWKANSHVYPTLTKSARKYLSILATSIPSERLFSAAREVIVVKRNRIKPKNVNMFLFLNKYK